MLKEAFADVAGLVGNEAAAAPLRQLVRPLDYTDPKAETSRNVLDDVFSDGIGWPISKRLDGVLLNGRFGVMPKNSLPADRTGKIAALVTKVSVFADRSDVRFLATKRHR